MTGKATWAPDQRDVFHALADGAAKPYRSLCGLRVDVADFLLRDEPPLGSQRCRSCLEKLESRR